MKEGLKSHRLESPAEKSCFTGIWASGFETPFISAVKK